jgi:hypothetical protein
MSQIVDGSGTRRGGAANFNSQAGGSAVVGYLEIQGVHSIYKAGREGKPGKAAIGKRAEREARCIAVQVNAGLVVGRSGAGEGG